MKYAAFLRGVNVGGVVLKMEDLRELLGGLGFESVHTYIQSGNAIFDCPATKTTILEKRIVAAILDKIGLDIPVIVLKGSDLATVAADHPFYDIGNDKFLHVTLAADAPDPKGVGELEAKAEGDERFAVRDAVIYGFYRAGYGKSKYTNNYLEKILGTRCTTRNWRTILALARMIKE